MLSIAQEAPTQDEVLRLLRQSDEHAMSLYPPKSNHLVDVDALSMANVRFFVARWNGQAIGFGAMVVNAADASAELKRLFVDPAARGRGAARMMLECIEGQAERLGVRLILLETGTSSAEAL